MNFRFIYKAKSWCALALTATLLGACNNDLLELTPADAFSDVVVFDNPDRIAQQVNGLYRGIKNGQFLGGRYYIYNDIRAEEFLNRLTNGVTGLQTWNHTLVETNNEVNNLWNAAYQAINRTNVFLEGLQENQAKYVAPVFPADFTTTLVPQYQAEARFLRAISYFSLLQLYARPYADGNGARPGVPLRLQAETSSGGNDLARSSVAEVYAQILEDLNFAEQNLPVSYGDAFLNITRAHRNTAIALKTRVYLVMGNYGQVIEEAGKIVSAAAPFTAGAGVAHALAPTIGAVFATPQLSVESIFSMPFSAQDPPGVQNQLAYYYLPPPAGNGEYYLNPAGIISNPQFEATDARRDFIRQTTVGTTEFTYLFKYPSGSPFTDNAPVIRYAEVLLNLAEARARANAGVDEQAVALLNAIRTRSNASALAPASQEELINSILTERRIELLGEGFRSIDQMRQLLPIPGKATISAVAPSDPNYVWPMPAGERLTNTLLEPN